MSENNSPARGFSFRSRKGRDGKYTVTISNFGRKHGRNAIPEKNLRQRVQDLNGIMDVPTRLGTGINAPHQTARHTVVRPELVSFASGLPNRGVLFTKGGVRGAKCNMNRCAPLLELSNKTQSTSYTIRNLTSNARNQLRQFVNSGLRGMTRNGRVLRRVQSPTSDRIVYKFK